MNVGFIYPCMAEWKAPTLFYFLNDTFIPFVSLLRNSLYCF